MNVLKFGGTSVGSAQRIQEVAKLISDNQPKIVVLSAMSGTTNTLVDITNYLYRNDRQEALTTIQNLELDYLMTISDLYSTEEFKHRGQEFVQTIFTYLRSFINKDFYPLQEKAVVAQGEIISTTLMHYYLQEQGIPSTLLSALDFMRIDKDCEPDYFYIEQNLKRLLSNPATERIIITQGFICRNAYGEIDNLKRGGSDYSAALIGAALNVDEIQIWTDIDGVHNSDPRYVKNTKAIRSLSFDEAAELAYFDCRTLLNSMQGYQERLERAVWNKIDVNRAKLERYGTRLQYLNPESRLRDRQQYAADVQERIQSAMEQKIKDKRHRLSLYLERFHGLSPLRKLNQGYSYVSDKEGKTLTSVSQVKQGDGLLIYVTDGTIEASVQNTKASSYGADTDSEK